MSEHSPETIQGALRHVESTYGVRILYACESGSRAWGFASEDSDWDVRAFFVRPQRDYLRVREPADHIHVDLPGELDVTAWDLRKGLSHAGKSSASVLEWLHSPIVYHDAAGAGGAEGFGAGMRALAAQCFRVRPTVDHYLGLAHQLQGKAGHGAELNGKKMLYVLRASLAARWALTFRTAPPVEFARLLPQLEDSTLRAEVEELVRLKRGGTEADAWPVSPALRAWLSELRAACEAEASGLNEPVPQFTALDDFFYHWISSNP